MRRLHESLRLMEVLRMGARHFNPHRVERLFREGEITWEQAWDGLAAGVKCNLVLSQLNQRRKL